MTDTFNIFPQDISRLLSETTTIYNPIESTAIKDAISAANKLLDEAGRQAKEIIETAKKEAFGEVEATRQQGFHEGFSSALKMFSELQKKKEKALKDVEDQAFHVALRAARQITGEIVRQDYQQIISNRIKQALSVFALQHTVKIKLNNVDYQMLSAKLDEFVSEHEQTIDWQPTDSMPAQSFEVSIEDCKLEADIEKQLDSIFTEVTNNVR